MKRSWPFLATVAVTAAMLFSLPLASGQKMKAAELIAKHLNAVGETAVDRKTAAVQGRARLQILVGGRASLEGPFYLVSRSSEMSYYLLFNASTYEHERFLAGPERAEVAFMSPGKRSTLGDFLHVHPVILREGLWGGVLSTAYPLFDLDNRGPKLRYAGFKKEEGRRLHRIDYRSRRGQGGLRIHLFFDPETFHHVRTSYVLVTPAPLGANEIQSARLRNVRHRLTEDFGNFANESGLAMPREWTVRYTFHSTAQTLSWEWKHELDAFQHDVDLDDSVFMRPVPGS